jgi:hypothetical protein
MRENISRVRKVGRGNVNLKCYIHDPFGAFDDD